MYIYTTKTNFFEKEFRDDRYIKKRRCHCKRQLCCGYFIPHLEGQANCLFDIRENGIIYTKVYLKKIIIIGIPTE